MATDQQYHILDFSYYHYLQISITVRYFSLHVGSSACVCLRQVVVTVVIGSYVFYSQQVTTTVNTLYCYMHNIITFVVLCVIVPPFNDVMGVLE